MTRAATAGTTSGQLPTRPLVGLAILEAVPAWVWVGALVCVSSLVRFLIALNKPAPWIFADSIVYSDLAKSFAATGHFALREEPGHAGFGVVYPVLLSPAYALFANVASALTMMKAINAVLMSLAAVPTYFLARRLVGHWLALTAAILAVALPDVAYSGTIMTENAFYPVFMLWCWATVRALEAPTIRRQVVAIAALFFAYATRPQAVVLVPALVTAVATVSVLDVSYGSERLFVKALARSARRFLAIWLGLTCALIAYLGLEIGVRGQGWQEAVFGSYSWVTTAHFTFSNVGHWFVYHLGELAYSLAIMPFAGLVLLLLVGLRPRQASPELRIFAAFALSAVFWLVLGVAAFASTPFANRIMERSMFYVDPLFLIALVACVGRGLVWSHRTAAGAAALIAVGLASAVPYISYIGPNNANDTFGLLTLQSVLDRHLVAPLQLQAAVVAGSTIAGLAFVVIPKRLGLAVPALTLLVLALANGPVERRIHEASVDSLHGGIQAPKNWIDHAVGTKPVVAALWTGHAPYVTLWDNEFFNRSVGKVYNFFGPPDGLPQQTVSLNAVTGAVRLGAQPVRVKYVLADFTTLVKGTPVARDVNLGMTVYRVDGPLVLQGQVEGVYPDQWSGPTVTYDQLNCNGGTLTATLLSDRDLHPKPQVIVARSGKRELARFVYKPGTKPRKMTIPLIPAGTTCPVTFDVPTAIPQQVTGLPDTRALGVRFLGFAYRPAR